MVNFLKILHQVSRYGQRKSGYYRFPIYRVQKTETAPLDPLSGVAATYSEVDTEISGDWFPFVAKRWGKGATENLADFVLATNLELTYDEDDDTLNDDVRYRGVLYRIVETRHYDRIAFDDCFFYLLRREHSQTGGP